MDSSNLNKQNYIGIPDYSFNPENIKSSIKTLEDIMSRFQERLIQAKKETNDKLEGIDKKTNEALKKDVEALAGLFKGMADQSVTELLRIFNEAKKLLDYVTNTKEEDITDKFGFSAEQLKEMKTRSAEMQATLDSVTKKTKETTTTTKNDWDKLVDGINAAFNKMSEGGLKNIGAGLSQLGTTVNSFLTTLKPIQDNIETLFGKDAADDVKVVTDALGATAQAATGVGKALSGDIIGGAKDLIAGVTKIIGMHNAAEKRHKEALKKLDESRLAMQRQYNLLLMKQNLLFAEATSIFGERKIEKAANSLKVYQQAMEDLHASMKGDEPVRNSLMALFGGEKYEKSYQKQLDDYNNGIGELSKQKVVTGHKKTGMFGWGKGKDTYSGILEVYPDLINKEGELDTLRLQSIISTQKMSDETKKYLQNLLDLDTQAKAASKALDDYLKATFGALGSDLMKSITNSLRNEGANAWEDFGKAGAKVIETLGEQLAYELFLASHFEALQADLKKVYEETSDPEEIANKQMGIVGDFFESIGPQIEATQNFMKDFRDKAAGEGIEIWGGSSSTSSTQSAQAGAFTTMSQDQASKLEGLFTSVQNHISSMDDKMTEMSAAMYESIDVLVKIEENTSFCRELETIQQDIKAIIRDGLKVK